MVHELREVGFSLSQQVGTSGIYQIDTDLNSTPVLGLRSLSRSLCAPGPVTTRRVLADFCGGLSSQGFVRVGPMTVLWPIDVVEFVRPEQTKISL